MESPSDTFEISNPSKEPLEDGNNLFQENDNDEGTPSAKMGFATFKNSTANLRTEFLPILVNPRCREIPVRFQLTAIAFLVVVVLAFVAAEMFRILDVVSSAKKKFYNATASILLKHFIF